MPEEFNPVKKADETIAQLLQSQPNLLKEQYPSVQAAEELAEFIETLRNKLIDIYNLRPPI